MQTHTYTYSYAIHMAARYVSVCNMECVAVALSAAHEWRWVHDEFMPSMTCTRRCVRGVAHMTSSCRMNVLTWHQSSIRTRRALLGGACALQPPCTAPTGHACANACTIACQTLIRVTSTSRPAQAHNQRWCSSGRVMSYRAFGPPGVSTCWAMTREEITQEVNGWNECKKLLVVEGIWNVLQEGIRTLPELAT